jgi:hypothetical protein
MDYGFGCFYPMAWDILIISGAHLTEWCHFCFYIPNLLLAEALSGFAIINYNIAQSIFNLYTGVHDWIFNPWDLLLYQCFGGLQF